MHNPFHEGVDLDFLLDMEEMAEKYDNKVFLTEKEKRLERLNKFGITPANRSKKKRKKKKK